MIKFKWEIGKKIYIFNSFKELARELRKGGVDPYKELSDEFLINESWMLNEWDYEKSV